jgi:hypothetical protein
MDPFARKMWRAGFAYAALMTSMAAALTAVYVHNRPRCGDRIVSESNSPDRHWTATVLERRCGEEAPFITQINLRDGGTALQRGFLSGQANQNNVFTVEQDAAGAGLHLTWNGDNEVTIHCRHCDPNYLRRQDPQHGALTIRYEFR